MAKVKKTQPADRAHLTPMQMEDKNGHMVTRWVKLLPSGEPALNIPAPQSPALTEFAMESLFKLFPQKDEKTGYLMNAIGDYAFYTEDFVVNALESLPPRTLRKLNDMLTGETTPAQVFLALSANEYITALYDHGQEDGIAEVHSSAVIRLNNSLLFHEALENMAATEQHYITAMDYSYMMNRELARYEGVNVSFYSDEPIVSAVDYGAMPRRKRNEAIAFIIASHLTRQFATDRSGVNPEFTKFVYDHIDRQADVISLVQARGADDVRMLRTVMNSEVPALADGEL